MTEDSRILRFGKWVNIHLLNMMLLPTPCWAIHLEQRDSKHPLCRFPGEIKKFCPICFPYVRVESVYSKINYHKITITSFIRKKLTTINRIIYHKYWLFSMMSNADIADVRTVHVCTSDLGLQVLLQSGTTAWRRRLTRKQTSWDLGLALNLPSQPPTPNWETLTSPSNSRDFSCLDNPHNLRQSTGANAGKEFRNTPFLFPIREI